MNYKVLNLLRGQYLAKTIYLKISTINLTYHKITQNSDKCTCLESRNSGIWTVQVSTEQYWHKASIQKQFLYDYMT
jgi:hypothetical protein